VIFIFSFKLYNKPMKSSFICSYLISIISMNLQAQPFQPKFFCFEDAFLQVHSDFVEIYCEGIDGWLHVNNWRGKLESSSEEFINDGETNLMRTREEREPWKLKNILG